MSKTLLTKTVAPPIIVLIPFAYMKHVEQRRTVLPDRKQVLEFGSSSRNHSTPACILTDAIPSCFSTITNSSLTIIFFLKKSYE